MSLSRHDLLEVANGLREVKMHDATGCVEALPKLDSSGRQAYDDQLETDISMSLHDILMLLLQMRRATRQRYVNRSLGAAGDHVVQRDARNGRGGTPPHKTSPFDSCLWADIWREPLVSDFRFVSLGRY